MIRALEVHVESVRPSRPEYLSRLGILSDSQHSIESIDFLSYAPSISVDLTNLHIQQFAL